MLLESRAGLRLAQHRHADAHADLLVAANRWNELRIRHPGLAAWRVHDSEALAALGDFSAARRLAEDHLGLAEHVDVPGPRGAGLRALARTADRDEAIPLLEQAVDLLAASSAQLEYTRALVELGAALRRANRRAAARDPLRRALDLADRGGMLVLARPRAGGTQGGRQPTAAQRAQRTTCAHARRAPRRPARRRGAPQSRDRRTALRHPAHRRDSPHPRLPEAQHRLPQRAPRRPPTRDHPRRPSAHQLNPDRRAITTSNPETAADAAPPPSRPVSAATPQFYRAAPLLFFAQSSSGPLGRPAPLVARLKGSGVIAARVVS